MIDRSSTSSGSSPDGSAAHQFFLCCQAFAYHKVALDCKAKGWISVIFLISGHIGWTKALLYLYKELFLSAYEMFHFDNPTLISISACSPFPCDPNSQQESVLGRNCFTTGVIFWRVLGKERRASRPFRKQPILSDSQESLGSQATLQEILCYVHNVRVSRVVLVHSITDSIYL